MCVFTGIVLTVFLFTLSVVLVLNSGWLYEIDIRLLNLEKESGMSAADIRINYDALIRYNQLWSRESLAFPTLPLSANAAIHFREVKRIFDGIQITCAVTGILGLFLLVRQKKRGSRAHFRIAGILSIALPVVLGILAAVNWDRFFTGFHRLLFRNDYWLFDPRTDPVILILPDTYFMHCAAGILLVILAGALLFLYLGRRRPRSGGKDR